VFTSNFASYYGKIAIETSEMSKGASEDQIMGRTHISYWLSEFKSSVVSTEDVELSGHRTKSTTDENVN
jgi:hypothetical protein